MFENISNAPYVFFPIFFGSLALAVLVDNTANMCPGYHLAFKHAAECPLNMPFAGVRTFDLKKAGYSNFQLFRMSFGIVFSILFIVAGWIGRMSGVLSDYPELESFAWNPVFYVGALFLFLHSQMTWERLHNGIQLCDIRGFIPCCLSRSVIGFYTWQWVRQVQALDDVMETRSAIVMVGCTRLALGIFVLIDVIRLVVISTKGQKAFFTPSKVNHAKV